MKQELLLSEGLCGGGGGGNRAGVRMLLVVGGVRGCLTSQHGVREAWRRGEVTEGSGGSWALVWSCTAD